MALSRPTKIALRATAAFFAVGLGTVVWFGLSLKSSPPKSAPVSAPVASVTAMAVASAAPAVPQRKAPHSIPSPVTDASGRIRVIDVHVHLSEGGIDRLRELSERWGIAHVVNLSGGHPMQGLQEQMAVARASNGLVTNFVSLAYEQAQAPGYGQRMAYGLEMGHRLGARGLKIAKILGLHLRDAKGKLIPVDDPELDPVFETAGRLGMPVAIHVGDPRAFWLPVNAKNERHKELEAHPSWSLFGKAVPSFDAILTQLERRIARHPKTTFISVHFGNCAEDPDRVARWLRKYPNLYIDTAARIPEFGRHSPEEMRAFFVEFQDRILYGSDLGIGPPGTPLFLGSEGTEEPGPREEQLFFSASRRYFETNDRDFETPTPIQGDWKISGIGLPRDVLEKIYFRNAARVLNLDL